MSPTAAPSLPRQECLKFPDYFAVQYYFALHIFLTTDADTCNKS